VARWTPWKTPRRARGALLGFIRDHQYGRSFRDSIDEVLGKRAPTLKEFLAAAENVTGMFHAQRHGNLDIGFLCFISKDGTKLARVTAEADSLVVMRCETTLQRSPTKGDFRDAPSAVASVAKFLGVE
jgi:hypothetical protein